jgi:hypothetical protein
MPDINGTVKTKFAILWGVAAFVAAILAQQGISHIFLSNAVRDEKIAVLERAMPAEHQSLHVDTMRALASLDAKVNLLLERSSP